jgi:hypothetical protein
VLGLPAEGPATFHGVLVGCGGAAAVGVCGRRARRVPYKGVGRVPLAARRLARSSRRRAFKAGADGHERHQFTADGVRDEAEAAAQTGQYRGGEDGSTQCDCQVGSRRTRGGTRGRVRKPLACLP